MVILRAALFLGSTFFLAGCTTYNVGSQHDSDPNGSYAGSTLNSPVTDQNPHVGGDPSYPASVSDVGQQPPPPQKVDGR
jgi:hypothetical protein